MGQVKKDAPANTRGSLAVNRKIEVKRDSDNMIVMKKEARFKVMSQDRIHRRRS